MKKIWKEIQKDLTREKIITNARKNCELPFGYVFDYIKDVYGKEYPDLTRVSCYELAVALCVKLGVQRFATSRVVLMFKGYDYGEFADYVIDTATNTPMLVPTGMECSPNSGETLIWVDEDMKEIPVEVAKYSMSIAEVYPYKVVAKTKRGDEVYLNILAASNGDYYVGVSEEADTPIEKDTFIIHGGTDGDMPDCDCTNYEEVLKFAFKYVWDNVTL